MKKIGITLLLLVGLTVTAQRNSDHHHRTEKMDLSPEQIATLHTKKMTLALDLTESQQSKVQKLNLDNAKARKAKMEEHKARKESNVKPTSEERYAMKMERLDNQIAQKNAMKSILSAEQFTKWEKLKMHHKRKKGDKMKHRKSPERK